MHNCTHNMFDTSEKSPDRYTIFRTRLGQMRLNLRDNNEDGLVMSVIERAVSSTQREKLTLYVTL